MTDVSPMYYNVLMKRNGSAGRQSRTNEGSARTVGEMNMETKANGTMSAGEWIDAVGAARDLGAQHGRNAAGWWQQDAIGGRASGDTKETARRILLGIEDGDPEVLDSLPSVNLSGEWAGDMTPARLYEHLDLDGENTITPEEADELCQAYEDGASVAVQDEVARRCRLEVA